VITWQDAVLAICQVAFAVALVETIRDPAARVPRRTSVPTCLGLWASFFVFATLRLDWTALACLLNSILWFLVFTRRPA